ncbi:MAG: VanZ family protein [Mariprofundaceae bacterium]|nr:VanZ family protein [Mariprofundaceae bacterium]
MMAMNRNKSAYIAFGFIAAIAFESTCPPSLPNDVFSNLDKMAHFFAFGFVAWFVATALVHQKKNESWGFVVIVSFLLTSLLAIGNEWIQSFNPNRVVSLGDILAGMSGAASFALAWRVMTMRKLQKNNAVRYLARKSL